MKQVNSNIIKEIKVIEKEENYQKLYFFFGFKTKNISIDGMDRTEILYLDKKSEQNYLIYGKILSSNQDNSDDDVIHLENGYTYLNISEFNGGTKINYITEMNLELPKILVKLPGILAMKVIKNLKAY